MNLKKIELRIDRQEKEFEHLNGKRLMISSNTETLHIPCAIGKEWKLIFIPSGNFIEPNVEIWIERSQMAIAS